MTDAHDVEAILAMANTYPNEVLHSVPGDAGARFTWDYAKVSMSLQQPHGWSGGP